MNSKNRNYSGEQLEHIFFEYFQVKSLSNIFNRKIPKLTRKEYSSDTVEIHPPLK